MYFWNTYPFVRFTIALILGIVCFDHFSKMELWSITVLCILISCYSFSILLSHKTSFYKLRHINGILAFSILFIIGGNIAKYKYQNHPSHHQAPERYEPVWAPTPSTGPNGHFARFPARLPTNCCSKLCVRENATPL